MTTSGIIAETTRGEEVTIALRQRIVRGLDHYAVNGARIVWVDDDRCRVPSKSRPGRTYLVIFGEDGERCSCKDHKVHGKEHGACLHSIAALVARAKRRSYRVAKKHDSRLMGDVFVLIEERTERELYQSSSVAEVYGLKWELEAGEAVA